MFVGPNEHFKLVIDEFDGEMVQAWHVEDPQGNTTGNLVQGEGKEHIDLLLSTDNRTVGHFITRYASRIYSEWDQARETIAGLQAQIEELEAQLEETQQSMK